MIKLRKQGKISKGSILRKHKDAVIGMKRNRLEFLRKSESETGKSGRKEVTVL